MIEVDLRRNLICLGVCRDDVNVGKGLSLLNDWKTDLLSVHFWILQVYSLYRGLNELSSLRIWYGSFDSKGYVRIYVKLETV